MHKTLKLALAAATPVLLLAGCSDFLKGPGLSNNPNQPTQATPDQLWVAAQVSAMATWENYPMMLFTTWAQQISGVARQWSTYARYGASATQSSSTNALWNNLYGPGGYRDLQAIVESTTVSGNLRFRGMARVLEALEFGTNADVYGSIPFDSALRPAPQFDSQLQVYAHVLSLLDSAISDLGGAGIGTGSKDFFFNNDQTKWIAVAHTLKARFLMHTAPTSATMYNMSILASVATEAALGIADSLGSLRPNHTTTPGEQNLFYSFISSRAGDVDPGRQHIDEVKLAGEDTLLYNWYIPNKYKNFYGSDEGAPGSVIDGHPFDSIAVFLVGTKPATSWPIVDYAENQMLIAEVQYRQGNIAGARTTVNNYRISQGQFAMSPAPALDFHTLQAVMREKYVRLFFNMEVWNDYLRTCYPNFPLPFKANSSQPYAPAREPVAQSEQNSNSANVPAQPQQNPPNPNNFKHLLAIDGTACHAQVNQP